jgi:hypothetical protein
VGKAITVNVIECEECGDLERGCLPIAGTSATTLQVACQEQIICDMIRKLESSVRTDPGPLRQTAGLVQRNLTGFWAGLG